MRKSPNIVRLCWKPDGYQPVGYSWPNYSLSIFGALLAHDLYHHQPNESGRNIEEFRALGARFRFDGAGLNGVYRVSGTNETRTTGEVYRRILKHYEPIIDPNKKTEAPKELRDFCEKKLGLPNVEYWLEVLMDGYNYGLTHSKKAYLKVAHMDFEAFHKAGKDISLDLKTGKIVKLTNSPAKKQFQKQIKNFCKEREKN